MKKLVLTLFFCVLWTLMCSFERTVQTNNICVSGSKYVSNVYEVNFEQKNVGVYQTGPRKIGHEPQDPFQDPIGDVPAIVLICFICVYCFYKKKEGSL